MFLWLLACSVELKVTSETSIEDYQNDSGDWGLAETPEADSSAEDGFDAVPMWWKLFAEMHWDASSQQYDVILSRQLYDSDFDEICHQSLTATAVQVVNAPVDDGAWVTMEISIPEQECSFQREDTTLTLGIGSMFPDLEIALQMLDWMDNAEQDLYQGATPFGGYASFGVEQDIFAFGAAFPTGENSDVEPTSEVGDWILRPIYAFKW